MRALSVPRRPAPRLSYLAIAAFAALGCSPRVADTPDAAMPPDAAFLCVPPPDAGPAIALTTLADYCRNVRAGLIKAELAESSRCGAPLTEEDVPHLFEDYRCESGLLAELMRDFERAISDGRMAYDAAKAAECIALGRASDGGLPFAGGELIRPCLEALVGKVPVGNPCRVQAECEPGAYCTLSGSSDCSGLCAKRPGLGEACAGIQRTFERSFDPCAAGLSCTVVDGKSACQPEVLTGICSSHADCPAGRCFDGRCTVEEQVGDACDPSAWLTSTFCTRCDPSTRRLIARKRPGESCSTTSECGPLLECRQGLCALRPRQGEPCQGSCLYADNWCPHSTAAICSPFKVGYCEPCTRDEGCAVGRCEFGVCAPAPRLGENCVGRVECAQGSYCALAADGVTERCEPLKSLGDPCVDGKECESHSCEADAGVCAGGCLEPEVLTNPSEGAGSCAILHFGYLLFFAVVYGGARSGAPRRR